MRIDIPIHFRGYRLAIAFAMAGLAGTAPASAQNAESAIPPKPADQLQAAPTPAVVERSARGEPARAIRIGVYLNVQQDCTSGTLPSLRLLAVPSHGTISIKRGKVSATNYKQCLALEVPGFVAFYQSKPDFVGTDEAIIEVKYPQGRTEVQHITINVESGRGGQKI